VLVASYVAVRVPEVHAAVGADCAPQDAYARSNGGVDPGVATATLPDALISLGTAQGSVDSLVGPAFRGVALLDFMPR
jgi:hypothetical protein